MKRNWLPDLLKPRIVREGNLVDLLTDAIIAQETRWIVDQIKGRPSKI